jgi:alpha-mannosidase
MTGTPLRVLLSLLAQGSPPASSTAPPPQQPAPIQSWLITRPYPTDTGASRVARDYLGGEGAALPDSDADWRPLTAPAGGVVDLNQALGGRGGNDHVAVYALSYLYSVSDQTRTLLLASDDDVVAWLNGQRIHRHDSARGADVERDTVVVRLAAGWNTLLMKVVNRQGGFGFGAWVTGEPIRAENRRPKEVAFHHQPSPTVTLAPIRLGPRLTWRGGALTVAATLRATAWGRASIPDVRIRLTRDGRTIASAQAPTLDPASPADLDLSLTIDDLATFSPPPGGAGGGAHRAQLSAAWRGGAASAPGAVAAPDVLRLLDGRVGLDWERDSTLLETRLIVPRVFAGLTLDLLAAELGPGARFAVNGMSREWRDGVVMLCGPCALDDTLAVTVTRVPNRPWWDAPMVRVRDLTYDDIARNVALLPALGDSSAVERPDGAAWLAAMLQPDKAAYGRLRDEALGRLGPRAAAIRRDTILLVGNSHIDAAWLWRSDETRDVVEHTWRTALKLQQKFPTATFAASSAQYYRWLETQAPGLLDSIKIAAGAAGGSRWEAVGGWWVEADQNVPGGESLVRQGLYGQRYFQRAFGRRARIAWTPDSFGYPWSMPQIWKGLGMDAFVTQKIRWNDSTDFPHDAFVWQGVDGTRLFTYNPWGYDHDLDGGELGRQMVIDNRRTHDAHHMLVLYGVGDHGGGPTIEMLERREDLARLPAYPVLQDDRPGDALAAIRAAHADTAWPVWNDELYLEYHRGTYTTQAWMKRRNRRSEELLGAAEFLAAVDTAPYPREALRRGWEQTLFNQFHDLLPGSGIRPIYLDAMATYDSVEEATTKLRDAAARRLAARTDTRGGGRTFVVFNPSSWTRTGYVAVDSQPFLARDVPPLGAKAFRIPPGQPSTGLLRGTRTELENDDLLVVVDTLTGQITRLYDKRAAREALPAGGRANALQLFGDRPRQWDAWDIGYTGEEWAVDSVRAARAGGDAVSRWIEVDRPWNATRIVQRIVLRRAEPWVEVENTVDWHETHKLLKVAVDVSVGADSATYEIAYGAIGQPTAPRTQGERAKYEHAGHRWADLSDSAYGVSVLNDSKYGWDIRGHRIRLSLLRAPAWPDSLADRGVQRFRYAIYPHAGDWRAALTERRGQEFNVPLLAVAEPAHAGALGREWSLAQVAPADVYVTAVKRAEDSDALVLRLVEWHGRATQATIVLGRPVTRVRRANLLEDPGEELPLSPDRRQVTLPLRPFEIATLLVEGSR